MSLLRHVVGFDLRRYRWLVAGWIVVTLATVTLQAWGPFFQGGRRAVEPVDLAITFGWFAQILLAGVLLPLLVHTHAATGTTAFWMTRPFPPSTLVRSKLLLLTALFLGIPAICDAAVMVVYRVPLVPVLLAVAEASLQRAAVLFIFLSIAVLTPNFARFAIAIGGAVLVVAVIINLWVIVEMSRSQEMFAYAVLTAGDVSPLGDRYEPDPTRAIVAAVAVIIAGVLVLIHQYRTRATKRTIAIAIAGAAIAQVIALAWPWQILKASSEVPNWTQDASSARLVTGREVVYMERGPDIDTPSSWRIGRGYVFVQGVPAGWLALTRLQSAVVTTQGGDRIDSRGVGYPSILHSGPGDSTSLNAALKAILGVDAVVGPRLSPSESLVMIAAPRQPTLDVNFAGSYRGEFAIDLAEMSVAAVLPLTGASTFQSGALRITLVENRWYDAGVNVSYRMSDVRTSGFDRTLPDSYDFYLRSPSRRQATEAQHVFRSSTFFTPQFGVSGMHLSAASPFYADRREMNFSPNYYGTTAAVNIDRSWMDDAELVIVRTRRAGTITRTLEVPQLQFIAPKPR